MNTDRHIASAFDRDLEGVQALVLRMGGLVESALGEAADALEIPIGTVMSRLARARERLRAMLSGLPPGGGTQLKIVK